MRAIKNDKKCIVRNANHIRPWQHVLEALNGYLILIQAMSSNKKKYNGAWNFGPSSQNAKTVKWLVKEIKRYHKIKDINLKNNRKLEIKKESKFLSLNSNKAKKNLNWQNKLTLKEAIKEVVLWHIEDLKNKDMTKFTKDQISKFTNHGR